MKQKKNVLCTVFILIVVNVKEDNGQKNKKKKAKHYNPTWHVLFPLPEYNEQHTHSVRLVFDMHIVVAQIIQPETRARERRMLSMQCQYTNEILCITKQDTKFVLRITRPIMNYDLFFKLDNLWCSTSLLSKFNSSMNKN